MGLHTITNDGMLYWKCHKPKPDCKTNSVHISNESVKWVSPTEVALPACVSCGEQRTLKVVFSDEEKQADNMITYGMVPVEKTFPHAITGEPIPIHIPELMPIGANPYVARHQELARQLVASGKVYE